jgi:hypothetical protein
MVDSLENRVRHMWGRVMDRFAAGRGPLVRTAPSVEPADIQAAWAACHASVRELFASHHGRSTVEDRFRIPEDYATFMQTIGGGWHCPHGLEWSVFDAATVASTTAGDFELFVLGANEDEPVLARHRLVLRQARVPPVLRSRPPLLRIGRGWSRQPSVAQRRRIRRVLPHGGVIPGMAGDARHAGPTNGCLPAVPQVVQQADVVPRCRLRLSIGGEGGGERSDR